MNLERGDHVEFTSLGNKEYVFRGVIEGFIGSDGALAMCTDQTGRPSRPVKVSRLVRITPTYFYSSRSA